MTTSELRQRVQPRDEVPPTGNLSAAGLTSTEDVAADEHPSGKESYGRWLQGLRIVAFALYFTAGCCSYVPPSPSPSPNPQPFQ